MNLCKGCKYYKDICVGGYYARSLFCYAEVKGDFDRLLGRDNRQTEEKNRGRYDLRRRNEKR